jgi:cell division protein FtsX
MKTQELAQEFLAQYIAVAELRGQLIEAEAQLAQLAKALCEDAAIAAGGKPILLNTVPGLVTIRLDEEFAANDQDLTDQDWIDYFANHAIVVERLVTPDKIEQGKAVEVRS